MKSRSTRDRLASIASWSGAVAIVVAGTFSCVSYPIVGARDGSLSAMFAPFAPRATRDSIATAAAGTYIDRILADRDSVLDRWPDRADDPIRVWIDSVPGAASDQAGFAAAVNEAFDDWAAVGIPVRFRFLSSPQHAEIHVRWIDRLANKTGSTSWRATRDGWLQNSEITLATHVSSGRALDRRGMHAIALHEIGHALGLSHSDDDHNIMAPLVRVTNLSSIDCATVRLLYRFQAGRVR